MYFLNKSIVGMMQMIIIATIMYIVVVPLKNFLSSMEEINLKKLFDF